MKTKNKDGKIVLVSVLLGLCNVGCVHCSVKVLFLKQY